VSARRVAVVGAGIAGLVAAYRLGQRTTAETTIYEATTRVGGRIETGRGLFAEGQYVERGAEFIDSSHARLLALAAELGLAIDDLDEVRPIARSDMFYVDGAQYSATEARADFEGARGALERDARLSGSREDARALDDTSVQEWIRSRVPGGLDSKLGRLLDVACTVEFGAETSDQSALNVVSMLSSSASADELRLFGSSDARYLVRGGADRIVAQLGRALRSRIRLGHRLTALSTGASGALELTFAPGSARPRAAADQVVLALPFIVLREVDLTGVVLSDKKRTAIAELGMATNAKLHLQFDTRYWEKLGSSGDTVSDRGYQCTWEATRSQPGTSGILVNYVGGATGAGFAQEEPETLARRFLTQIEPVFPGLSRHWNGKVDVACWSRSPYQRGSYAYYRVGQYTRFAGVEGLPEGPVHFAGEHTSTQFQGFMEGAVESAERAAGEVIEALA
jgi:monoamine oxidase